MRKHVFKIIVTVSFIFLLSIVMLPETTSAIVSQNSKSWYFPTDTDVSSSIVSDVDNDGAQEIITVGYYNDGTRWIAYLAVYSGVSLSAERVQTWRSGTNTQASSVAVGDVDADGQVEIVTGGSYYDGAHWIAQLNVWNGLTLANERRQISLWGQDSVIFSVAVGDVDADGQVEIVTGGSYFSSSKWTAQLFVWSGASLAVKNYRTWITSQGSEISSVAVGDVDADGQVEIVAGGSYYDGVKWTNQLTILSGRTTLATKNNQNWLTGTNTRLSSVAVGDVDADGQVEIVAGGSYYDVGMWNAQFVVFNGSTLAVKNSKNWVWVGNTTINSVRIGNVTGGPNADIITGGYYYDGFRANSQVMVWNGANLGLNSDTAWFWISDTWVNSVTVANFGAGNCIVASGSYFDLTQIKVQLSIWK